MNIFLILFNTINGDFMKIIDIMNKDLIVSNVSDDISSISNKMLENDIGFIPIVDGNHIVGVITDRDIACRIFNNDDVDSNIVNYMSRDVISVSIDDDVLDVLKLMAKYRVKRVLVTDNKHVVGTLSISDLLNIDEYKDELYDTIKSIWKIGPSVHKYESEIDEFYL